MVVDDEEKANILNTFFSTVFTVENEMLGEIPRNNENPILRVTNLTQEEVRNRLNKIKIDKSPGPDGIHPRVLRELSNVIDKPLFLIFSDSIATGSVPQDWRIANVVPIFKKGSKSEPGNYRPVSLTSIVGKIFEGFLRDVILDYLNENNCVTPYQHGFMRNRSCQTNLISFYEEKSSFIPLSRVRALEKVEEKSFGNSNVMQIIYTDENGGLEALYLQCKCVNELNQWLSALRKICVNNSDMLGSYHPGVYKGEKWSCCHQKDKGVAGCDKTRHEVTLQEWNDLLNPDLEAQLIFRHLIGVRELMREKHLELTKHDNSSKSHLTDPARKDSATELFHILKDLETAHDSFLADSPHFADQEKKYLLEM
ncbi:unnamed protein product [Ranitomeya imitator]|uniref:PH domain-containing protein n=1 Tax=Ranitomeya imitator TaxID=111125 RepID=A0ABN9KTX2_9NEOB|nr:unnamed protein product [Ranitomeya imitator]